MSSSFIQRDSLDVYEVGQLVHTRRCQSVQTLHMTVEPREAELPALAAVTEYTVGDKIYRLNAAVEYDPDFMTSAPTEQSPAVSAAASISEEILVSIPTSTVGRYLRPLDSTSAAARPICVARSHVSSVLAMPRTPSVPNNLPMGWIPFFVLLLVVVLRGKNPFSESLCCVLTFSL